MKDKKEKEKFVWYQDKGVLLVLLILAMGFLNLALGNPMGR